MSNVWPDVVVILTNKPFMSLDFSLSTRSLIQLPLCNKASLIPFPCIPIGQNSDTTLKLPFIGRFTQLLSLLFLLSHWSSPFFSFARLLAADMFNTITMNPLYIPLRYCIYRFVNHIARCILYDNSSIAQLMFFFADIIFAMSHYNSEILEKILGSKDNSNPDELIRALKDKINELEGAKRDKSRKGRPAERTDEPCSSRSKPKRRKRDETSSSSSSSSESESSADESSSKARSRTVSLVDGACVEPRAVSPTVFETKKGGKTIRICLKNGHDHCLNFSKRSRKQQFRKKPKRIVCLEDEHDSDARTVKDLTKMIKRQLDSVLRFQAEQTQYMQKVGYNNRPKRHKRKSKEQPKKLFKGKPFTTFHSSKVPTKMLNRLTFTKSKFNHTDIANDSSSKKTKLRVFDNSQNRISFQAAARWAAKDRNKNSRAPIVPPEPTVQDMRGHPKPQPQCPKPPPPSALSKALCLACHKVGHWAGNCRSKAHMDDETLKDRFKILCGYCHQPTAMHK